MFNYFGLLGRLGAKLSLRFWYIGEFVSISILECCECRWNVSFSTLINVCKRRSGAP